MAELNGVLVDAGFLAKINGGVQQNLIGSSDGKGCSNCKGAGVIVHTSILGGPFEQPPATAPGLAAIHGKAGWFIGKSTTDPCPMCMANMDDRIAVLIKSSNVPFDNRSKSLDFLEDKRDKAMLLAACRKVLDSAPNVTGLITFFGSNGTGKTTAAMILCIMLCREGVRAVYTTGQEIANSLKETWNDPDRNEQDVIDGLMRVQFLVIDEVDRVSASDRDRVNQIIDLRYRNRDTMATLLITNMDISSIRPGEDGYLKSRMADGIRVPVYGEDMRQ